jgi:hypothetical protein
MLLPIMREGLPADFLMSIHDPFLGSVLYIFQDLCLEPRPKYETSAEK